MKVEDVMTRDVAIAHPEQSLQQAARLMCELDIGALPVADDDRLVGMITDRDIVIRAVAEGLGPSATVGEVMTTEVNTVIATRSWRRSAITWLTSSSAACRW
jgi:CBS domain-containing protein